jgi:hypothetical protein
VLDDLAGAVIGGLVGEGIAVRVARARAGRKARRFLAGEAVTFRAYLRREGEGPVRGRVVLIPGTDEARWAPWPRRGRAVVDLLLLGGRGYPEVIKLGWWYGDPAGYAWTVRIGATEVATFLIERNYVAAFAPALSLGATPPPHRKRR